MSQSRQQNPPTVSQSPPPPPLPQTHVKVKPPFSIRQYVLASRHKSVFHSWPFPHKYLQMCLNHGLTLTDVLPPFRFQTNSSLAEAEPLKGASNLMMHSVQNDHSKEVQHVIEHQQQNIKNDYCDLSRQEKLSESAADTFTIPACSIHDVKKSCPTLAPSSKAIQKDKRTRGRGRRYCKKRSMVDILAVARHCTLEEIYKTNKFCYVHQTVITEDHEAMGENSFRKGDPSEDHEAANRDVTGKGTLMLKFKLSGCNVNWNSWRNIN